MSPTPFIPIKASVFLPCHLSLPCSSENNLNMPPPKAALLVGAGAVENAWQPVIRAIQPYYNFPLTNDSANSFLARVVYLLRWWSSSPPSALVEAQLKQHIDLLNNLRVEICRELLNAQETNELTARPQFIDVVDNFLLPHTTNFMLVNTNWDTVIDSFLIDHLQQNFEGSLLPLHIHGSVTDPSTLYLPTEVTKEPYRSFEEEQKIGGIHGSIMRCFESANRIIIYGLSLSPLDAELIQTLAAGCDNDSLEEIFIVVPDHELVAHRVKLLISNEKSLQIIGYDPNNLDSPINYSENS